MKLSSRAAGVDATASAVLTFKAIDLRNSGKDVVFLGVGEPDWPTFKAPSEAAIKAINESFTKYVYGPGLLELREVIATETHRLTGVLYNSREVCVSAGARMILASALEMLCDDGDEVLIPAPCWFSYPTLARLCGAVPQIITCDSSSNFKLTAEMLSQRVSSKSKVLILCSPNNPTGAFYDRRELGAISEVLKSHPDLVIISDDIYSRLNFSEEIAVPHLLQICPELKERLLVVNGVSKTYSMTGWRVGWGVGPKSLIDAINVHTMNYITGVNSIAQKASVAAIKSCDEDVKGVKKMLSQRRDFVVDGINSIDGFSAMTPQASFYLWVDVSRFFTKAGFQTSAEIAKYLLEKYFVGVMPGTEFGLEGYLRLSFASAPDQLKKGLERLQLFSAEVLDKSL